MVLPHFQLPQFGSTPAKLKAIYSTPEAFMKSAAWTSTSGKNAASVAATEQKNTDKSSKRIESAQSFDKKYAGWYTVIKNCNLMAGAGSGVVLALKKGVSAQCYGYYTAKNGKKYLYVSAGKKKDL